MAELISNRSISLIAVLAASMCIQAAALSLIASASDPLGPGSWDKIVSTEHTGEYLAKTGGFESIASGRVAVPDMEGNWSFNLTDEDAMPAGTLLLRLFQSGGTLFGYGTIRSQSSTENVTADGSAANGVMILGVVCLRSTNLYRLALAEGSDARASGTFSAIDPSGKDPVKGAVSGQRC